MPDKNEEEHKIITDKLNELLKIMNGNGKIGQCAKVNLMWSGSLFIISAIVIVAIKAFLS